VLSKIINFFFIPIEIKAVHYELRILFHQFFPHCPHLLVDKTLNACQVDRDEIVHGIRKEKRLAHEIAITIVNNISANMLATGRYHVFRGVLDNDEGARLYSVFLASLEMLKKHSYRTEEEIQEIKKVVDIDIATIG